MQAQSCSSVTGRRVGSLSPLHSDGGGRRARMGLSCRGGEVAVFRHECSSSRAGSSVPPAATSQIQSSSVFRPERQREQDQPATANVERFGSVRPASREAQLRFRAWTGRKESKTAWSGRHRVTARASECSGEGGREMQGDAMQSSSRQTRGRGKARKAQEVQERQEGEKMHHVKLLQRGGAGGERSFVLPDGHGTVVGGGGLFSALLSPSPLQLKREAVPRQGRLQTCDRRQA